MRFSDDKADEKVLAVRASVIQHRLPSAQRLYQPFAYELRLLSGLQHKNIVKLCGFVESAEGGAWMIFPWAHNGNVHELIQKESLKFLERLLLVSCKPAGNSISIIYSTLDLRCSIRASVPSQQRSTNLSRGP